jgi:branched-subunit amino acid transport protein
VTIWLTMVAAGLLTFLIRFSFIGMHGRWRAPAWLERALRFVPAAVLSAIILPELLLREGSFSPLNPRLAAAVVAALVAWRSKSAILAIVSGMAALLLIQLVLPLLIPIPVR